MLKKQGVISTTLSPIQSLKFSAFNYFGLGAVLAAVTQSFWINFSAYYLNNILPSYGNLIFLLAQIFEGVGILLGWLILVKLGEKITTGNEQSQKIENQKCLSSCSDGINLHMLVYIAGAFLLIFFLPLTFFMPLSDVRLVFTFSILSKIGSGLMIISQITIIPKITQNRNRRRKLVQKVTQFGLGGTFISMFSMTFVSVYVNFIWKYFIGVCVFVFIGAICSIFYVLEIRALVAQANSNDLGGHFKQRSKSEKNKSITSTQNQQNSSIVQCQIIKSPKFYIYSLILIFSTLYMDIVIAIYPYFIKSFQNITHFRYLSCISALYLSAFICSLLTKNAFVFSGIRLIMSIGFISCVLATVLFVIGLADQTFDTLMIVGTCLTGIAKVIAINCAMNLINQFVGKEVKGREFVYGIYYFLEKVITGVVLYSIVSRVYLQENQQFLHFSEIYLPFILYALTWVLVMVDRSLLDRSGKTKSNHIVIVQPKKDKNQRYGQQQKQNKQIFEPTRLSVNDQIPQDPKKCYGF